MTRLSTLPSTREQARHALLLLGVPTPARLLVDVHAALFDGDLSVPGVAALLRDEERIVTPPGPDALGTSARNAEIERGDGTVVSPYLICPGLNLDLTAARGVITLSTWPVADRLRTPAAARADALATVVRVAEFVAERPGGCATWLMRDLAATVPGGREAFDVLDPAALGDAARHALADASLAAAVEAEAPLRDAAAERAAHLDLRQRLFGLATLPHQRGGE
jgi:hypothetical protein